MCIRDRQKELEVRITEEKIARPRLSENQVRFWLTRFRKLDPNVKSHRETLINTFVNAVYLCLLYTSGHDLTKRRDVKGSQSRTAGNQNAFCRLAAGQFVLFILFDREAIRLALFEPGKHIAVSYTHLSCAGQGKGGP